MGRDGFLGARALDNGALHCTGGFVVGQHWLM